MTDRALWLMVDGETTGLLDERPTLLEIAWMVVDDQLHQLTPLRQRLTAIAYPTSWWRRLITPPWSRFPRRTPNAPLLEWPVELMSDHVTDMHQQSGLMLDWVHGERIEDAASLDDLIMADLAAATSQLPVDTVIRTHLAGAGVAQFEARLLPALGSKVTTWCHYRAADVSVAAMVLGVPKIADPDPDDGLELDIQVGVDIERAITTVHRAATDVRIAYRTARLLRRSVAVTREALESR